MKKISVKKILSVLLALSISLSVPEFTYAADTAAADSQTKDVQVVFTAWDNLNGSTYAYDRLSDTEKALYDKIKERLDYYLRTNADFEKYYESDINKDSVKERVYKENIFDDTKSLSEAQLRRVVESIDYSKYYFWDNSTEIGSSNYSIGLQFYNDFADGDYRAKVSNELNEKINYYKKIISSSCENDEDKINKINELICDMTDYDHSQDGIKDASIVCYAGVNKFYARTIYAPLTERKAVCTAYSGLFSILSEGLGFEAMCVCGDGHEWNKIKVNDTWYAVDVTMNDNPKNSGGGSRTYALLVKDNVCLNIYDELNGYVPTCEHDYFTEKKEAEEKAKIEAEQQAKEIIRNKFKKLTPKGLKKKKSKKGTKIVISHFKLTEEMKEDMDSGWFVFEFSNTKKFKKTYTYTTADKYVYLKKIPKKYRKYVRVYFCYEYKYSTTESWQTSGSIIYEDYKDIYSKKSKILKIS